jgi:hypothetical protein
MKIIKSFLLMVIGLCTSALLHAQEVTTQVQKHTEVIPPPASAASNAASPAPVFKPQPAVAATAPAAAAVAETPSAFKKKEAAKTSDKPKLTLAPTTANPITEVQPPITQTQMQPVHLRQQKK